MKSFSSPALSSLLLSGVAALACSDAGGGGDRYANGSQQPFGSSTPAYPNPNQGTAGSNGSSTSNAGPSNGSAGGTTGTNEGNPNVAQVDPNLNDTGVDSVRLGSATMGGEGSSQNRYQKSDVTRDGKNYYFMANGWGPGFVSQSVSWKGTSFTVESMQGTKGPNYEPASYPTMFCGAYSDARSRECGLPRALDGMSALETGWSWEPNGNNGEYNAAYDIWLGTSNERSSFSGYLMVWYREPVGQQPAGQRTATGVTVANVAGTWDIWTGTVAGSDGVKPIINWVRSEGQDTHDMEFDVLDFVADARMRNLQVPGTHVLSVAVGFELWSPVTKLQSLDFYVDAK
ncbi:MAG: hypothetical protein RL685_1987 [Pseudomonadota bacterium]|jgi:hypothetical protein